MGFLWVIRRSPIRKVDRFRRLWYVRLCFIRIRLLIRILSLSVHHPLHLHRVFRSLDFPIWVVPQWSYTLILHSVSCDRRMHTFSKSPIVLPLIKFIFFFFTPWLIMAWGFSWTIASFSLFFSERRVIVLAFVITRKRFWFCRSKSSWNFVYINSYIIQVIVNIFESGDQRLVFERLVKWNFRFFFFFIIIYSMLFSLLFLFFVWITITAFITSRTTFFIIRTFVRAFIRTFIFTSTTWLVFFFLLTSWTWSFRLYKEVEKWMYLNLTFILN